MTSSGKLFRLFACVIGLGSALSVGPGGFARADTPSDATVCMTPDLVQAVLQATNEANAKDKKELVGVANGKLVSRSQGGLTCIYDGDMKVTDASGPHVVKVKVTGKVTASTDGTDIDTSVAPAE